MAEETVRLSVNLRRALPLLLLAACASLQPSSLRIMTYNIHAGRDAAGIDNLERVAAIITSSKADIVLLQEVDRKTTRSGNVDQLAELTRRTGMHGVFGKSLDYQGGEYGIAILSRWAIVAHDVVPLRVEPPQVRAGGSIEPRVALIVMTHGLRIANTHLDASRDDRYRMQEVPQLLSAARDVITGGDFNSTPDSAVHEEVVRAGLRDAWPECGAGNSLTYPATPPEKRIDYVFLSRATRCRSAVVLETTASDHRPVLVLITR
ncbi:MAG TPA: endonuclease/exonuclease/phosphatase family protein [Thermoanaerobaculia bacterium]